MADIFAITRQPSPSMDACELTHLTREPIDHALLVVQHARYVEALRDLGLEVVELPPEPDLPDAIFVEDPAVVLDEVAVITRPGAASRRPECESLARALAPHRDLVTLTAPATLDGGDVIRLGRMLYIGLSSRSNDAAIGQLTDALSPFGYVIRGVPVAACLHLKSAATAVGENTLLAQAGSVDSSVFGDAEIIHSDPAEPGAANAVWLDDALVHAAAFPRTRARLEAHGHRVVSVDLTEISKAEGAVTCCSLIVRER